MAEFPKLITTHLASRKVKRNKTKWLNARIISVCSMYADCFFNLIFVFCVDLTPCRLVRYTTKSTLLLVGAYFDETFCMKPT